MATYTAIKLDILYNHSTTKGSRGVAVRLGTKIEQQPQIPERIPRENAINKLKNNKQKF